MFDMNEDYNSLLADFDKSITDLFPHFADEVNKLLKPDQLYTYDQNSANKLNTELRILALVRLGVADNKQIASFSVLRSNRCITTGARPGAGP